MSMGYRNEPSADPFSEGTVDLRQYLRVVNRNRRLIATVTLLCVALAAAYSFTATKLYTGTATLELQPTLVDISTGTSSGWDKLVNPDNEMAVVKSIPVANIAATTLNKGLPASQQ